MLKSLTAMNHMASIDQRAGTLLAVRARLVDDLNHHMSAISTFTEQTNNVIIKYRVRHLVESYMLLRDNFFELEMNASADRLFLAQIAASDRELEGNYFQCKATIIQLVPSLDDTSAMANPTSRHQAQPQPICRTSRSWPTLSTIHLPLEIRASSRQYSLKSSAESWKTGQNSTTCSRLIANNVSITNVHKMHYLKTSLSDTPGQIIKHLPCTTQSFPVAWKLLQDAYQNKRAIIEANLSNFFDAKALEENDADGLRRLINVTNNMLSALQLQGVDTKSWDPILAYWIGQKLNEKTAQYWEDSLTDTREMPDLKRLSAFLESRANVENRAQIRRGATLAHPRHNPRPRAQPIQSRCWLKERSFASTVRDPIASTIAPD